MKKNAARVRVPQAKAASAPAQRVEPKSLAVRSQISARVRSAVAGLKYSEVARQTGFNDETTRRYLRGHARPSVEFLVSLCTTMDISPDWLLLGKGPKRRCAKGEAVAQMNLPELLRAMAEADPRGSASAFAGRSSGASDGAPPHS